MTMTERIRTRRAGRLATALTSGGLALAVIGVAAPASADPVPEATIQQNCEARGGSYWTQVGADGNRQSTCSTNDGASLSCVDNYRNGERWGGSCNRAAPPRQSPPPAASP